MKREPEATTPPAKKQRKRDAKRGQSGTTIRTAIGRDQPQRILQKPMLSQLDDMDLQKKVLDLKRRHFSDPDIAKVLGLSVDVVRRLFGRATEHYRIDHQQFCTERIIESFDAYEIELRHLYGLAFGVRERTLDSGETVREPVVLDLQHARQYHRVVKDRALLVALLNARNIQVGAQVNVNVAVGRRIEVGERAQMAARRFGEHAARAIPEVVDVPAEPVPENRDHAVSVEEEPEAGTGTEGE